MVNMNLLEQMTELRKNHDDGTVRELMEQVVRIIADHEDDVINRRLLNEVIEKNVAITKSLKNQMAMIELLSVTDALTGLYNRHKFNEEISDRIAMFSRYGQTASMVMFDIDHFKQVNDTYGHNVGDQVLMQLARICRNHVRQTDVLSRWGGEEFVVMLPSTGLQEAGLLAEKLRILIEETHFEHVGKLTCSFGAAELKESDTKDSWVGRADAGLYEAKQSGRNRVCTKD